MDYIQSSLSGKTCPEPSHQIMGTTFKLCSRKSDRPMFQCLVMRNGLPRDWHDYQSVISHGEHLTLSFGESPNAAVASSLSQILQKKNRCAAEVLFVEQSVPGDTAESRTAREEVATVAGDGAQAPSWCIAGNIINRKDKNGGHHLGVDENVSFTLNTIDRHAVFAESDAYCLQGSMIGRKEKNGPQGSGVNKNVLFTLNTVDHHAVCIPDVKTYSVQAIGHIVESEKSSTLAARDYKSPRNFVEYSKQELASGKSCTGTLLANASTKLWTGNQEAFSGDYFVIDKNKEVPLYDISHLSDGVREIPKGAVNTLAARMGTGGGNVAVLNEADRQETDEVKTVRRLTVTECERLQGLPDGYTDVPLNRKPASDSERLKAIGNGMAQPCADFIISKVVEAFEKTDS